LILQVKSGSQISPLLEGCYLRVSANVSYQRTADDIELLKGMRVSAKTQQRLVRHQSFETPLSTETVAEAGIDGGMVRFIVEPVEAPQWKAIQSRASQSREQAWAWLNNNLALSRFI
jgi:hypothetical protein